VETVDLTDIERRPQRYWNIDGLPELMMGLLWIVWGGAWLLGERIPRGSLYNAFWMFVPAILALSGSAVVWATRALKTRITFPRAGYIAWQPPTRSAQLGAAAVCIMTAMILAATVVKVRNNAPASDLAAPVLGVILSLAFLIAAVSQHAPHYLALAGVAVALGIALGARGAGWESANWLFLLIGVASAAVGAARLLLFLRSHPRPAESA
jgi:hypothetical protein